MVKYLPREAEADVVRWLERGKSVVLVGPRQAGKTTLLKHLSEERGWEYLTLDDEAIRRLFEDVKDFARMYRGKTVLIDEAQYDENVGRKLKYLYDVEGMQFVASGSGSFDIKVRVSGELVGRAARVELLPLNFSEFVRWKMPSIHDAYAECRDAVYRIVAGEDVEPPLRDIPQLAPLWREYVVTGGYPEVVLAEGVDEKRELLRQIVSLYIDRDVVGGLGVREYEKFRRAMSYLAYIVSAPLKKAALAEAADASYQTIQSYLSILMLTFVVFPVYALPVSAGSLRKMPKIYFFDNGLRNVLIGDLNPYARRMDRGALLENFVARHLRDRFQIHYFRTKVGGEVDFVAGRVPIEVRASGRISRALHGLMERLEAPHAVVVYEGKFRKEGDIYFVPPWFL